jgi:hypothetical protein
VSNTYPAFAFQLGLERLPVSLDSYEQVVDLLNDKSIQNEILCGSSRRGWLAWMVEAISKKYELTCLDFLYCELPTNGYYATILNGNRIESVIAAITKLLTLFETKPAEIVALDDGGSSEEDVLRMLRAAKPSLHPKGDDGDHLGYLFAYLKSLLEICESAKQNGNVIVYAQFDGG